MENPRRVSPWLALGVLLLFLAAVCVPIWYFVWHGDGNSGGPVTPAPADTAAAQPLAKPPMTSPATGPTTSAVVKPWMPTVIRTRQVAIVARPLELRLSYSPNGVGVNILHHTEHEIYVNPWKRSVVGPWTRGEQSPFGPLLSDAQLAKLKEEPATTLPAERTKELQALGSQYGKTEDEAQRADLAKQIQEKLKAYHTDVELPTIARYEKTLAAVRATLNPRQLTELDHMTREPSSLTELSPLPPADGVLAGMSTIVQGGELNLYLHETQGAPPPRITFFRWKRTPPRNLPQTGTLWRLAEDEPLQRKLGLTGEIVSALPALVLVSADVTESDIKLLAELWKPCALGASDEQREKAMPDLVDAVKRISTDWEKRRDEQWKANVTKARALLGEERWAQAEKIVRESQSGRR